MRIIGVEYAISIIGEDAILSLPALLDLKVQGFTFDPIMQHGEILSIVVYEGNKVILTIRDSIKLLDASLAKLLSKLSYNQQLVYPP